VSWAQRPVSLHNTNSGIDTVVLEQVSLDIVGSIGITPRAAVGLAVPAVLFQHAAESSAVDAFFADGSLSSQALGDVALSGKVTLLPYDDLGGFGLAALARVSFPTGSRTSFVGEGSLTSELRVLAEMHVIVATLQATAGFKQRITHRTVGGQAFGDEIPWGLGVTVFPRAFGLDEAGRWAWTLEAHGALPASPDAPFSNAATSPVLLGASARYRITDGFAFMAGLEASLSNAIGAPTSRTFVGLSWTPQRRDSTGADDIPEFVHSLPFLPDECDPEAGDICADSDADPQNVPPEDQSDSDQTPAPDQPVGSP